MTYQLAGFDVASAVFLPNVCTTLQQAVADLCLRFQKGERAVVLNSVSIGDLTRRKPERNPGVTPDDVAKHPFIIGDLLQLDNRFSAFLLEPALWFIAARAMGLKERQVVFHFSNVTRKPPNIGPAISWHRDYANTYFRPHAPDFVRLLVPLQDMNDENGGTGVIPSSHRVSDAVGRDTVGFPVDERKDCLFPRLNPGDVLSIHPKIVHGGQPNRGAQQRDVLVLQFGKKDSPLRFAAEECMSLSTREDMLALQ